MLIKSIKVNFNKKVQNVNQNKIQLNRSPDLRKLNLNNNKIKMNYNKHNK
jgi:hypothetical protein